MSRETPLWILASAHPAWESKAPSQSAHSKYSPVLRYTHLSISGTDFSL
jgi:hypothetical protein